MPNFAIVKNEKIENVFIADSIEIVQLIMPGEVVIEETEQTGLAITGGTYLDGRFFPLSPYPSWSFDRETCSWVPPVSSPEVPSGFFPSWNEEELSWELLEIPKA